MTATSVEGHYLYGVILGSRGIKVSLARLKAYKRLNGVRGKSKRGVIYVVLRENDPRIPASGGRRQHEG